jgi:RNA polymerase sigma-70 factor (ECF subfamily)
MSDKVTTDGDRAQEFVKLFAGCQRRIYGFVVSIVTNSADADDIFGEISVGLWKKFDDYKSGSDFLAWSIQFARYAILRHYRTQRLRKRLVFSDEVLRSLIDEAASAVREIDSRHEFLRSCLEQLPAHSRELIRARYETGMTSCREVADRTGRSVEAIYKALRRLHERLLCCIEQKMAAETLR